MLANVNVGTFLYLIGDSFRIDVTLRDRFKNVLIFFNEIFEVATAIILL